MLGASAAVAALLHDGPARETLDEEVLHAPHLVDLEIVHTLRRLVALALLDQGVGWIALDRWRAVGAERHPASPFLRRVWELRDNVSAYDAAYVALAESLECALVTADARLSRAPGIRCPVTVVPR